MNKIPEKCLDCPYYDPDVCYEGCMLQDEPTDGYAHNEDDQPEYVYSL